MQEITKDIQKESDQNCWVDGKDQLNRNIYRKEEDANKEGSFR